MQKESKDMMQQPLEESQLRKEQKAERERERRKAKEKAKKEKLKPWQQEKQLSQEEERERLRQEQVAAEETRLRKERRQRETEAQLAKDRAKASQGPQIEVSETLSSTGSRAMSSVKSNSYEDPEGRPLSSGFQTPSSSHHSSTSDMQFIQRPGAHGGAAVAAPQAWAIVVRCAVRARRTRALRRTARTRARTRHRRALRYKT